MYVFSNWEVLQIAKFMGPTWGPPASCRPQVGPMWAPWTLLQGGSVSALHYDGVRMGAIASQITSLAIVYSAFYSGVDQRKHQSSASLAFVWGIHRDRWIPRTKGQLRGKCFHLMTSSWFKYSISQIDAQSCVVFCFIVVIVQDFGALMWYFEKYSSWLLNGTRVMVSEVTMNGMDIPDPKQNTTKREACAWFLRYIVPTAWRQRFKYSLHVIGSEWNIHQV